jgi:hypothetical protein
MDLFGVNAVRTEAARLLEFNAPTAYRGEDVETKATFRNTGNVPYAPGARLELRRLVNGEAGAVVASRKMGADRVAPGKVGQLHGSVKVPDGRGTYELRVRLARDGRELDSRAAPVTAVERPPFFTRVKDWVAGNALTIVLLLLGAIALGSVLGIRYIRRLKASAR